MVNYNKKENEKKIGARARDPEASSRKLAAIMFTDIVGYTVLTQTDEEQALQVLDRHNHFLRPYFSKFGGREVKTIGDSFLVEFDNASDATKCAIEIQKALHDFNLSSVDDWKIKLRIGIHLGDVVRKGGDIFGDAVNIASRIQSLADAEGVCVSQQVFDQIHNKIDLRLEQLEHPELKNVRFQTNVYAILMPWQPYEKRQMKSAAPTTEGEMRRIAILPFASMSPDPNDEYFADGMTEEIISTVSQIQQLRVISRTSVMRFKRATKSMDEIGSELSVGLIVEGSMRKYGNRVRVTAQLIDVKTDEHMWSDNYERDFNDVFAIQRDIASKIAQSLKIKLLDEEKSRIEKVPTTSPVAHELYLKGRHLWNERTEINLKRAIEYFERAIEKDPNFALAFVGVADCYIVLGDHGYLPTMEAADKAKTFARKALALDDSLAEAHTSLGAAFTESSEIEEAAREKKRAIELNPNYAPAHHWYGVTLLDQGKFEESISEARLAKELDPLSMQIITFLGIAYHYAGKQDNALKELFSCLELEPNFPPAHSWLAMVFVEKGMLKEAIIEAEKIQSFSSSSRFLGRAGYVYGVARETESAQKIYNTLLGNSKTQFVSPLGLAEVCTGMARYEEAINWLEKAYVEGELSGSRINAPWLKKLRGFPRFQNLLEKFLVPNESNPA